MLIPDWATSIAKSECSYLIGPQGILGNVVFIPGYWATTVRKEAASEESSGPGQSEDQQAGNVLCSMMDGRPIVLAYSHTVSESALRVRRE